MLSRSWTEWGRTRVWELLVEKETATKREKLELGSTLIPEVEITTNF